MGTFAMYKTFYIVQSLSIGCMVGNDVCILYMHYDGKGCIILKSDKTFMKIKCIFTEIIHGVIGERMR